MEDIELDINEYSEIHEARTQTEIRNRLTGIQAFMPVENDYIAGMLDGACAALGWTLGKTDKMDLGGF